MHIYSGDRHCSCGRDEGWQEVLRLQNLAQANTRLQADTRHASDGEVAPDEVIPF